MSSETETHPQRLAEARPLVTCWEHTYSLSAPVPAVLERLRTSVSTAIAVAPVRVEIDGESFTLLLRSGACLRGVLHKHDDGTRLEVRWGGFSLPPHTIVGLILWPFVMFFCLLEHGLVLATVTSLLLLALVILILLSALNSRNEGARQAYTEVLAALESIVEPLQDHDGLGAYR